MRKRVAFTIDEKILNDFFSDTPSHCRSYEIEKLMRRECESKLEEKVEKKSAKTTTNKPIIKNDAEKRKGQEKSETNSDAIKLEKNRIATKVDDSPKTVILQTEDNDSDQKPVQEPESETPIENSNNANSTSTDYEEHSAAEPEKNEDLILQQNLLSDLSMFDDF